ncbi:hypothetical protein NCC49_002472 [Naganishia albida]|nr:hypothetical protein NCC49_002472 [Naganishia albida]
MKAIYSVFRWEKQWVTPAGMPEGSTYKVLKWVKTAEKARFSSVAADINLTDDAEDVDMDGDDNDEQEDEKAGEGEAQADGVTDQEVMQLNSGETVRNGEKSSTIAREVQPKTTSSDVQTENVQPSDGNSRLEVKANDSPDDQGQGAAGAIEDVTMTESEPVRDTTRPAVNPANINASQTETPAFATTQSDRDQVTAPVAEATSQNDIQLPDIKDVPEQSNAQESVAPMELDVQQPLDKPEASSEALALPVASSVPMPMQTEEVSMETMQVEGASAESVAPVSVESIVPTPTIIEPTPEAQAPAVDSISLGEDSSVPPVERSVTPSPSPERIQEFREHEATAEDTAVVPGNLPSPSPQPEPASNNTSFPAPSNAVEGSVGGSHVNDVQFGGGAAGAPIGEVALEPTSAHEPAGLEVGEVTMEGETDPGKSLGEGDPVGVNGQEEFGDVDVRRTGDVEPASVGDAVGEKP